MDENLTQKPWNMELNTFCMLMHLSQFASCILPGVGIVLPIVMWATNKDKFPVVDEHGKVILNGMISAMIYSAVSGILIFIVIGIFGLIAVGVCGIVFAIMGGVKANNGEVWPYPLCIHFLK